MDAQKMVLKLYLREDRDKQRAMKAVSDFSGIESIAMDPKETKLTVIGTADLVAVVNKLRKICRTDILTAGPAKEPAKEPENKKEETKKPEPKKEEDQQIEEIINAYHRSFNPYLRPYYSSWG